MPYSKRTEAKLLVLKKGTGEEANWHVANDSGIPITEQYLDHLAIYGLSPDLETPELTIMLTRLLASPAFNQDESADSPSYWRLHNIGKVVRAEIGGEFCSVVDVVIMRKMISFWGRSHAEDPNWREE